MRANALALSACRGRAFLSPHLARVYPRLRTDAPYQPLSGRQILKS
jgi:hypothetical protein